MTDYKEIEATELADMISSQKILLVDVRNDDEVARGIIPGALHIPLHLIPLQYTSLNSDTPIVFYCHSGIRSAQAASFAARQGLTPLFNLRGGVIAWGRAGYAFAPKG